MPFDTAQGRFPTACRIGERIFPQYLQQALLPLRRHAECFLCGILPAERIGSQLTSLPPAVHALSQSVEQRYLPRPAGWAARDTAGCGKPVIQRRELWDILFGKTLRNAPPRLFHDLVARYAKKRLIAKRPVKAKLLSLVERRFMR